MRRASILARRRFPSRYLWIVVESTRRFSSFTCDLHARMVRNRLPRKSARLLTNFRFGPHRLRPNHGQYGKLNQGETAGPEVGLGAITTYQMSSSPSLSFTA